MRYFLSLLSLLWMHSFLFAQARNEMENAASVRPENTFALVIGIANYENDRLNLNFSNRDATIFADYLQSKAGGNIPEDNIRLLVDTTATTASIYNSLKWLKKKTELNSIQNEKEKSLVYIYFSGHGDVETNTKANLGFLLAYNTPPNNYINNAVRIEDLNDYAHTLSVDLNANVIIITDACHSGKLAGSGNKGSYLVGKELSIAKEREIRIASCNPDELSMEDIRWGEGRGVFSYYLVNGLKGMADKNRDSIVTFNELQRFVDSSIASDAVLKELKHKQTPVLKGNPSFRLASVNQEVLLAIMPATVQQQSGPAAIRFSWQSMKDRVASFNQGFFAKLKNADKKNIPIQFLQQAIGTFNSADSINAFENFAASIKTDSARYKLFTEGLVEFLHSQAQQVINNYLAGDEAELEKRRYYNLKTSDYYIYPDMLAVALKLMDAEDPLYKITRVNHLYLSGVAVRMKIPTVEWSFQNKLVEQALQLQLKALALDDNAAYIQNELGVLYKFKKEYVKAAAYFSRATELAPSWIIPKANLTGIYAELNKKEQAVGIAAEAELIHPGFHVTQINLGGLNEREGNLLFAEEHYRTAIEDNNRHYLPFERLGFVYLKSTNYQLADSFFHEADIRKRGFHFNKNEYTEVTTPFVEGFTSEMICELDTAALLKDDVMGYFYWGLKEYNRSNYTTAERVLKKIIAIRKNDPLVYHYLGKVFYDQRQWEKAELMFELAVKYYLPENSFILDCDSLVAKKSFPYNHKCFEQFYRYKHYKQVEDYYFMGTLYESWSHHQDAEIWYRKTMALWPADLGGYLKCWQLLEKLERYTDAEKIIQSFSTVNKERTDMELNAFYRRTLSVLPDQADWNYRLGMLMYERAPQPSRALYFDTIIYFSRINKEVFMDFESYNELKSSLTWDINLSGSPEQIQWKSPSVMPVTFYLPGIDQTIRLSQPIYMPRKDAVYYLAKAESLLDDIAVKGDINGKIGNVFVWAGSNKQAFPYYVKSVELVPANANTRMHLVDVSKAIYKNRAGLAQLNYLYDSAQINFTHRMLYSEWNILAAQFEKANEALREVDQIYPYAVVEKNNLLGRLHFLANKPAQAIAFYKLYRDLKPDDAGTLYTLAKLSALTGNKSAAWKWLQAALEKGFNYGFVLNADAVWLTYRKTAQWTALLQKFPMRKYKEPRAF